MIELMAYSIDIGLPLFIRKSSTINNDNNNNSSSAANDFQLNFATIFYGLNHFSRLNDCLLNYARTNANKYQIKWKSKGKLLLILLGHREFLLNEMHIDNFLELIIKAIELLSGENVFYLDDFDKQKRELKYSFNLLDYLLNNFSSDENNDDDANSIEKISIIERSINYQPIILDRKKLSNITNYKLNQLKTIMNREEMIMYWSIYLNDRLILKTNSDTLENCDENFKINSLLMNFLTLIQNNEKSTENYTLFLSINNSIRPVTMSIIRLTNNLKISFLINYENSNLSNLIDEIMSTAIINDNDDFTELLYFNQGINIDRDMKILTFIMFNHHKQLYYIHNESTLRKYMNELIIFCCDENDHRSDDHQSFIQINDLLICKLNNTNYSFYTIHSIDDDDDRQFSPSSFIKSIKYLANNLFKSIIW